MIRIAGLGVIALSLVMAGCSSDPGLRISVEGRILSSPGDTTGLAGVQVEIPAAGVSTVSLADGRFAVSGWLPKAVDGLPVHAAVWFHKAGLADVVHGITVIPDAAATVVAVMTRPALSPTVSLPEGGSTVGEDADNASFLFRSDSLVDRAGTPLVGDAPVTLAAWDASLPPDTTVTPAHLDGLYPPMPVAATTSDGSNPYLRPLAVCQFASSAGAPSAAPGIQVSLISRYAADSFGEMSETDDRLFLVNPDTGLFEEQGAGQVETGNRITFDIDRAGTWVWAKAVAGSTCVQAKVKVGRRPAPGAHVRLPRVDFQGVLDEALFDERIGAENGVFCLKAPASGSARATAFVQGSTGISTATTDVVQMVPGGDCATGCPVSVDILLPCENAGDCDPGEACTEGQCSATN